MKDFLTIPPMLALLLTVLFVLAPLVIAWGVNRYRRLPGEDTRFDDPVGLMMRYHRPDLDAPSHSPAIPETTQYLASYVAPRRGGGVEYHQLVTDDPFAMCISDGWILLGHIEAPTGSSELLTKTI